MSAPNLKEVKRIHFIGIGGAGMGGIAEVLANQGYEVTGSDLSHNAVVQRLQNMNVRVFPEHVAENVIGANVVVVSSAISADNPEIVNAKKLRIPVIPRAQMLADLMRSKLGVAIAGTHGKTTTTSLAASVLTEAGFDPTYVIGGLLKSAGVHAHLGQSQIFVAEADESDASFLFLSPEITVVTNIDADHLGTYNNDFNRLRETFIEFLHRLPFNGLAIVCADDPEIAKIIPEIARPTITYGFDAKADIQIRDFKPNGFQTVFTLHAPALGLPDVTVTLNLPGKHNVLNTAAVYAIAAKLKVPVEAFQRALQQFSGVGRRMQVYGEVPIENGSVLLVDDYGHHPREIMATWAAARQAWPERRLVVVYQPHRYSRTYDLFKDFVEVLSEQPDKLVLLDVYSAGEAPIAGADGKSLFEAVRQRSQKDPVFVPKIEGLAEALQAILQPGDVLLTQGAGNVGTFAPQIFSQEMQLSAKLAKERV